MWRPIEHHRACPSRQGPTMERWAAAIAAVNKTSSVLFQNCGQTCTDNPTLAQLL